MTLQLGVLRLVRSLSADRSERRRLGAAVVRLLLVLRLGTAEARPGWNGALLLQGEIGGGGVNTLAEGEDDL